MELINKTTIVAEIERKKDKEVDYDESSGDFASYADQIHYSALDSVENFINTIEVKEVDLEKEIDDWYNTMGIPVTTDALKETARYFFELGLKVQKGE